MYRRQCLQVNSKYERILLILQHDIVSRFTICTRFCIWDANLFTALKSEFSQCLITVSLLFSFSFDFVKNISQNSLNLLTNCWPKFAKSSQILPTFLYVGRYEARTSNWGLGVARTVRNFAVFQIWGYRMTLGNVVKMVATSFLFPYGRFLLRIMQGVWVLSLGCFKTFFWK